MAPPNKAKAAGVSASSFLDLKAELAKKESEFTKKSATRSSGGDKVCILALELLIYVTFVFLIFSLNIYEVISQLLER